MRPTSDLIRGVIFDMLDAMGADYGRVLDLYAGTGALGIEALSRGDGSADFVEADAAYAAVIEENLRRTRFAERARVLRTRAERAVRQLAGPYTLVLADPPYYDEAASDVLQAIAATPAIAAHTVFVVEHRRQVEAPDAMGTLPLYKTRIHGDTAVSIYGRVDDL